MDIVGSAAPRGVPFTVALRADMDCLPVNDETGATYKSQVPGYTHACGMRYYKDQEDNMHKIKIFTLWRCSVSVTSAWRHSRVVCVN